VGLSCPLFLCSGWEFELEQMRLQAEEASRLRAEADAIAARAEAGVISSVYFCSLQASSPILLSFAERALIAKQNAEAATAQRWKAAKTAAFAFASLDAALARQRAAAAVKLEAEALQHSSAENVQAEAAAAEAAATAERLRIEQERAVVREQRLGRARLMERQYHVKLLMRMQDQWLNVVAAAQQQRKTALAAESKNADVHVAAAAESEQLQYDSDGSHNSQSQLVEGLVHNASAHNLEEESVFKRLFTSRIQEQENGQGELSSQAQFGGAASGELPPPEDAAAVMIFSQSEPKFHRIDIDDAIAGRQGSPLPKAPETQEGDSGSGSEAACQHASDAVADSGQLVVSNYVLVSEDILHSFPSALIQESLEVHHLRPSAGAPCTGSLDPFATAASSGGHGGASSSTSDVNDTGFMNPSQQSQTNFNLLSTRVSDHDINAPHFRQAVDSPSSAQPKVVLLEEPHRDAGSTGTPTHLSYKGQHRIGPKTPQTPLLILRDVDSAAASVAAAATGSRGFFSATASDAESSSAVHVTGNRIGPKTPQTPLFSVRDLAATNIVGNAFPAIQYNVAVAPVPPSAAFRVGPRTPVTPAGPTRHVRQWLARQTDASQPQLQRLDPSAASIPHEPLFIRRSTKQPTVFEKIHALPSSVMSPFNQQLSNTSPSFEENYFVSSNEAEQQRHLHIITSSLHEVSPSSEGAAAVHPAVSDADRSDSNKLFHIAVQSTPADISTSPQRHAHGNRSAPTLPAPNNFPSKHADKSDVMSLHRATLLREMDAALRSQWPQSFQRTIQVVFLRFDVTLQLKLVRYWLR